MTFPSCKFLREATISFIELDPRDRLIVRPIGDIGGDTSGESSGGEDMKGIVFTHEAAAASIACLSGDPSYDSAELSEFAPPLGLC